MNKILCFAIPLLCITLFSCSLSLTKRRYNPGYYVDVIPHSANKQTHRPHSALVTLSPIHSNINLSDIGTINVVYNDTNMPICRNKTIESFKTYKKNGVEGHVTFENKKTVQHHQNKVQSTQIFQTADISTSKLNSKSYNNDPFQITFGTRKMDNYVKPVRLFNQTDQKSSFTVIAWILGVIAILALLVGIVAAVLSPFMGLTIFIVGLVLIAVGVLFGIAALVLGFYRKKEDK